MPALYSITTRASGTILTAAIYNADHQNHVNNGDCTQLGGYSANATQMKVQTYPGDIGSEHLALSIGDELARIRYVIAVMRGTATWYQGVPSGGGGTGTSYLPLTGGTLTGNLAITPPAANASLSVTSIAGQQVSITLTVTGQRGIQFYQQPSGIWGFYDTVLAVSPLVFAANGLATFSKAVDLDGTPTTNTRVLIGSTSGSPRWQLILGNSAAETGSNAGSNLFINRYNDSGSYLDTPFSINRSNGIVTIGTLSVNGTANFATTNITTCNVNTLIANTDVGVTISTAAGTAAEYRSTVQGIRDWTFGCFTDGHFRIVDNTAAVERMGIAIPTGLTTFSGSVQAQGFICKPGLVGAFGGNNFNINYTGSVPQLWIDNTNFGTFQFTSDYRTKQTVKPLPSMWDRVKDLKPISYRQKDFGILKADDKEHWGFIAHELQEDLIEDAASGKKDEENLIQSPNPWTVIATLTKALQEAMARIEALEAKA